MGKLKDLRFILSKPEYLAQKARRRSRLALSHTQYTTLKDAVVRRDSWKCRVCKTRNNLVVHHIVYRSHGGDDIESNLITLCDNCHNAIHKPHPRTGAMLVLLPLDESKLVHSADNIRFLCLNGFIPGRRLA